MERVLVLPVIAVIAMLLSGITQLSAMGLSALPLAIVLGMIYGHVRPWLFSQPTGFGLTVAHQDQGSPDQEGLSLRATRFCQQQLLRWGIILFGFNLSFQQVLAVGWKAVILDMIVITVILVAGTLIGVKWFKLHRDLALLISAGSAICGAAAVLAAESVVKPKEEHVTVAIATVVLFGTLAMFSYPIIYHGVVTTQHLMTEQQFGIYIGSTVHEVAQAVAAGESIGSEALQNAVVVKLIRVMMLAPVMLIIASWMASKTKAAAQKGEAEEEGGKITIPWFILGFIAAVGVNSIAVLPELAHQSISFVSQLFLALAMAALGMQTHVNTLRKAGIKPMLLALILFVLLMGGGFYLNAWLIG